MSDQWCYRIFGEDFGPVSEATIRSLIADGTIGPADEIRPDPAADWQRADSLAGRPSDDAAADADAPMDLDALLAPAEPVSRPATETSTDVWFYRSAGVQHGPFDFDALFDHVAAKEISREDEILAPGGTDWVEAQTIVGLFPEQEESDLDAMLEHADEPERTSAIASRHKPAQRWYYRVLNQELGPVDFDALYELVQEGNLRPDDEIREEDQSEWQRADSMVGLFPEEQAAATVPAAKLVDSAPESDEDEEPEWYFQFDDEVMGPVTFGRLMRMAAKGRLRPSDPIRLTKLGGWMEASAMVGLFPDEEPAEESSAEPSAVVPKIPPAPARPEPPADGDVDDWAAAFLSEPEPEPSPSAAPRTAVEEPEPVAATAARPASPSPSSAAVAQRAAPSAPPAKFAPPPKARRSGPSFSMPSLPSNLGAIFANPIVLGGGAVALLVVGLMYVPWGSLTSQKANDLVMRVEEIWGQVKPLYEQRAPETEWAEVAARVDPELKTIAQEALDRGASPQEPVLQIVHSVAGTYIPQVMETKQDTKKSSIMVIDNFMKRAEALSQ